MALIHKDVLFKLLDGSTKTLDKVGELMRDIRLIRRRYADLPSEYQSLLRDMEGYLRTVLSHHDTWEKAVADAIARETD